MKLVGKLREKEEEEEEGWYVRTYVPIYVLGCLIARWLILKIEEEECLLLDGYLGLDGWARTAAAESIVLLALFEGEILDR